MPYNLYINDIDLQLLLWWRFLVNISSQVLTTVIQSVLTAYPQYIYTFLHSIEFSVHISPLYNSQLRFSWCGLHAKDSVRKSASDPGLKKFRCTDCKSFMKIHSHLLDARWGPPCLCFNQKPLRYLQADESVRAESRARVSSQSIWGRQAFFLIVFVDCSLSKWVSV